MREAAKLRAKLEESEFLHVREVLALQQQAETDAAAAGMEAFSRATEAAAAQASMAAEEARRRIEELSSKIQELQAEVEDVGRMREVGCGASVQTNSVELQEGEYSGSGETAVPGGGDLWRGNEKSGAHRPGLHLPQEWLGGKGKCKTGRSRKEVGGRGGRRAKPEGSRRAKPELGEGPLGSTT